jgi:hypothetical protein
MRWEKRGRERERRKRNEGGTDWQMSRWTDE